MKLLFEEFVTIRCFGLLAIVPVMLSPRKLKPEAAHTALRAIGTGHCAIRPRL